MRTSADAVAVIRNMQNVCVSRTEDHSPEHSTHACTWFLVSVDAAPRRATGGREGAGGDGPAPKLDGNDNVGYILDWR